ncbi:MAG: hypothetical protein RLZZ293_866 [Pseudomonadota bacterium]|jgi:prepilin-type N-terminal cleavage/methylation domain-containing protein
MLVKQRGFSILEVMIAVTILASLGLGIYKLQFEALLSSQQLIIKQTMLQSSTTLIQQMLANLNYASSDNDSMQVGFESSVCQGNSCYQEYSYNDHMNEPSVNCQLIACNQAQQAAWLLYQWKFQLPQLANLSQEHIVAIVCRDNSLLKPTLTNPNCNGLGGLVVKIAWLLRGNSQETNLFGETNNLIVEVPQR